MEIITSRRNNAHQVAIANMWVGGLRVAIVVGYIIRWVLHGKELLQEWANEMPRSPPHTDKDLEVLNYIIWATYMLESIIILIKLVAGFCLLHGVKPDTEIGTALKSCRYWRNVTTGFLVLQISSLFVTGASLATLVGAVFCIIDVVFLRIVRAFTKELISTQQGAASANL